MRRNKVVLVVDGELGKVDEECPCRIQNEPYLSPLLTVRGAIGSRIKGRARRFVTASMEPSEF
jgi:hypothetical protein